MIAPNGLFGVVGPFRPVGIFLLVGVLALCRRTACSLTRRGERLCTALYMPLSSRSALWSSTWLCWRRSEESS